MPQAWDNPDAFVNRFTMSAYEPYPMLTGSSVSSVAPQSAFFVHWNQPNPLIFKNIVMDNSLAAGVAGATSQASTGSEGYSYALTAFLYSRQDYSASYSNLSFMTSGSFGLSAAMGYSSTSQTMGMSWVTNSTGGQSTLSTTSGDAGWSNLVNGPRVFAVPLQTTLNAGEYWMGFQQSSSSATSNSNVTLLSVSLLHAIGQQVSFSAGYLGQTTTSVTVSGVGQNMLVLTTTPTTSATMALNNLVVQNRGPWFALSGATSY